MKWILGKLFKSSFKQIDCLGKRKFVWAILNISQNVPMLIEWHCVCPMLEEFYFDISSKRLFGYLWCIGTKGNKIHDVRVTKINQKQTHTMQPCTFLIYIVSFKCNHNPNHIACSFIQTITSLLCHVLVHPINHIVN